MSGSDGALAAGLYAGAPVGGPVAAGVYAGAEEVAYGLYDGAVAAGGGEVYC